MDIDDFLDKETPTEKKEVVEKEEVSEETLQVKDVKEKTSVGDDGKEDDFSSLEKRYLSLWSNISKGKFLWNDELYTKISNLGNEMGKTMEHLSLEIHKQKNIIKQLIDKANKELENKNHDTALSLYSKIVGIRDSIPDVFIEEKKEVNNEIFRLYENLHELVDEKFINDFKDSIAQVNSLIKNSFLNIENGTIEHAEKFYEEAIEMYKNLPSGFLLQKIKLGNSLLALYKELSIHTQIKTLQGKLNPDKANRSYNHHGNHLEQLSEIAGHNRKPTLKGHHRHTETLSSKLIKRKLERASIDIQKGYYVDAKKNAEAVLKLDPNNKQAKKILAKLPA
jgi:tetratricopeptide (TPR) repeat protein